MVTEVNTKCDYQQRIMVTEVNIKCDNDKKYGNRNQY
jgi:hypothetical protein